MGDVVVLVNGTWGEHARWVQPDGPLPVELEAAGFEVRRFCWSGKNAHLSRLDAAQRLRQVLVEMTGEGRQVDVVAHSHGGNVALYALDDDRWDDEAVLDEVRVATLATPFLIARTGKRWWRTFCLLSPMLAFMAAYAWFVFVEFTGMAPPSATPTLTGRVVVFFSALPVVFLAVVIFRSWVFYRQPSVVASVAAFYAWAAVLSLGLSLVFLSLGVRVPDLGLRDPLGGDAITTARNAWTLMSKALAWWWIPSAVTSGWLIYPFFEHMEAPKIGRDSDEIARSFIARDLARGRLGVFRSVGDEASAGLLGSSLFSFATGRSARLLFPIAAMAFSVALSVLVLTELTPLSGAGWLVRQLFMVSVGVFGLSVSLVLALALVALVGASLFGVEGPYISLRMSLLADHEPVGFSGESFTVQWSGGSGLAHSVHSDPAAAVMVAEWLSCRP